MPCREDPRARDELLRVFHSQHESRRSQSANERLQGNLAEIDGHVDVVGQPLRSMHDGGLGAEQIPTTAEATKRAREPGEELSER